MLRENIIIHILLFGLLILVGASAHAEFYRWVDDEGTIHYSDKLPPSKTQRKQDILNEHGRTVKTVPAPKTADELKEEQRLAKLEQQKRDEQEKREKRDRTLLAVYLSVEEIENTRDERIATVQSAIDITELRKKKFYKKIDDLNASEKRHHEAGLEAPEWLIKSRKHYLQQIVNADDLLRIKKREKLAIKKRFSGEINRYIELKQPDLAAQ